MTRLISFTQDPERSQSAIDVGIDNVNDYPVVNLKLISGELHHIQLFLFPGDTEMGFAWGGLILDRTMERTGFLRQLHILNQLSLETRKSSASVEGNLNALSVNLEIWAGEIVKEFVNNIEGEVKSLNKQLDQLLLYEKSMDQFQFYPEVIDVRELIDRILSSNQQLTDRYVWISSRADTPSSIQIDPGLTSVAFEYLLLNVEKTIPPSQQVEVSLQEDDGRIKLILTGNMPLTLPGLPEEFIQADLDDFDIQLHLAQRIISAQQGDVTIEYRSSEPGSGLRIEVSLPAAEDQDQTERLLKDQSPDKIGTGRILVAESQSDYQTLIIQVLEDKGYRVDLALDGSSAMDMTQRINPDLLIVDRNLPGLDGTLVTQGIRRWSSIPIIMLSSRTNLDDLIQAFQAGVDDYIHKPFQVDELLVRVQAGVRRGKDSGKAFTPDIFSEGDVRINYSTRQVWIRSKQISLTPIEYNILVYMSRHRRQVMPYEQIIERAWQGPEKGTRQGLFVHIRRLRNKIELDPKRPHIIQNKWGVGYLFSS
jgi:DNA-binding response OmpR family regulator